MLKLLLYIPDDLIPKCKLLLIVLCFFTFTSCEKEEILPSIEMSLEGESFNPYDRYAQIKTFAGRKYEDNIVKKIFIL